MNRVKTNKSTLNKLIFWSSSRYNEWRKRDVIEDIIYRVERGDDCKVEYKSGVYSEGAHTGRYGCQWTGGNYILNISGSVASLSDNVAPDIILEKPSKNNYYLPAYEIQHNIERYGVPVGLFQVIEQDRTCFHVLHEGILRYLPKKDCTVISRKERNNEKG